MHSAAAENEPDRTARRNFVIFLSAVPDLLVCRMARSNFPTRRNFAKTAAAASASAFGFQFVPSRVWGANERVTLGGIGTGGKGAVDVAESAKAGFQVVALVDVTDPKRAPESTAGLEYWAKTRNAHPDAKFYQDYREMLADMGNRVDAVTVSTPDHHHFHAAAAAMRAGKHVYCQKPLTHSIWEARQLAKIAAETKVKTQMGNQGQAADAMRRVMEVIRAGAIGKVKEVHTWTDRPIWPQGFATMPDPEPVPAWLDWEQWIGPAPFTPYSSKIHPFNWRGYYDFGCGALGDMACHYMALAFGAIDFGPPTSVSAKAEGGTEISPPITSTVTYEFAGPGVKYVWYDGMQGAQFDRKEWKLTRGDFNRPGEKILQGLNYRKFDNAIVGDRGILYFGYFQMDKWVVIPSSALDGFAWPAQTLPRAREGNPYAEWLDSIRGKIAQSESHFGKSGPFTEAVLLGVIAQRFPGQKLEWDSANLAIKGRPDLQRFIRTEYRKGWEVAV